jgi:hypothetical protein
MRRLALCVALAAAACKSGADAPLPAGAPLPFSAEEVRAANPPGTILAYRVEQSGDTPSVQKVRFARSDDVAVVLESWTTDDAGRIVGEPVSTRAEWSELVESLIPPGGAVVTEARYELPAGEFDCWDYTVVAEGVTRRFSFAKDLPGAPVLSVEEQGGKVTRRIALQSVIRPQ